MRPYDDVLSMWSLCEDGELLDWQWRYERLLRKDPHSRHAEYLLQDVTAIDQLLRERKMK